MGFIVVLLGPFAEEFVSVPDPRIDAVLSDLAQSPMIYSVLSRQLLPCARDSAERAQRKIWLGYILLAAAFQFWSPQQQTSVLLATVWMLVTALAMWAVVRCFLRLPDVIRRTLAQVKFSSLLVFWLRGDLSPRPPEHTHRIAPIPGGADPARPLQLRI